MAFAGGHDTKLVGIEPGDARMKPTIRVMAGEMPPAKKPRPAPDDLAVVAALRAAAASTMRPSGLSAGRPNTRPVTDCDAACQQPQRSSYPSQKCSFVRKTESVVRFVIDHGDCLRNVECPPGRHVERMTTWRARNWIRLSLNDLQVVSN